MENLFTILTMLLALYALVMSILVITENRRPQSTLAWMLVLFFTPEIGLLIYLFFGRDNKAFSKQQAADARSQGQRAGAVIAYSVPAGQRAGAAFERDSCW